MSIRNQMRYLNPYDIHKLLINEYVLRRPGDTAGLKRDTSGDKTDFDILRDNHKFLWDDDETPDTWELQFAKKYYDKLFKEYCIADLSLYKENKIALRWRTEKEVIVGKGQFSCGNKKCNEEVGLRTWEVNFAYKEKEEKKNALVKIRLCPDCSKKLNYHSQKREVKRLNKKPKMLKEDSNSASEDNKKTKLSRRHSKDKPDDKAVAEEDKSGAASTSNAAESPWTEHKPVETKSREEEMEEYLQDLLL